MSGTDIDRAIEDVRAALEPLTDHAFGSLFGSLVMWWAGIGGDPLKDPKLTASVYRDELKDIPGDLLAAAFSRVRWGWRWPRFPKPADFRKAVEEELIKRRTDLRRMTMARQAKPFKTARRRPSEAEKAYVDRLVSRLHARFAAPEQSEPEQSEPERRAQLEKWREELARQAQDDRTRGAPAAAGEHGA